MAASQVLALHQPPDSSNSIWAHRAQVDEHPHYQLQVVSQPPKKHLNICLGVPAVVCDRGRSQRQGVLELVAACRKCIDALASHPLGTCSRFFATEAPSASSEAVSIASLTGLPWHRSTMQ